jgi:EmrB/QacA subfamily drug resistance transporter
MVLPLTQVTMARAAGPERLGRVMGVVGLFGQLAPVTGPVLGGLLVDGWGWRWAFLATAPPVLAALAMTGRWFPRDAERSSRPLDVAGLVLLPGGLVALLYALSGGGVALAVLGAAMITTFGVRALRRSDSLVDLRLFADPSFRAGTVMMFVLGVTTWGPMFLLPLYLQQRGGLSSLDAGLVLAPQGVGMGLAFLLVGRVADRLPPRPLAAAGTAVGAAATLPFLFTSDPAVLGTTLFARGAGFGVASLPVAVAIYRTLPEAAMAHASSASNVVQRIGAAAGTALMATVVAAAGFEPALLLMVVLTAVALASTIVLRPTPGGPAAPPGSGPAAAPAAEPHRRPRCR